MARLWHSGFESDTLAAGAKEWDLNTGTGSTVQGTTFLSGAFACKQTSFVANTAQGAIQQFSTGAAGPYFARVYLNITTLPTTDTTITGFSTGSTMAGSMELAVKLTTTGALQLFDDTGTQVGSNSATLSTGTTWYRIEMKIKGSNAGAGIYEAALDGNIFATTSVGNPSLSIASLQLGGNLASEANTGGTWFFDDVAINDSTGSSQATYPGPGKIIHMKPTGAGTQAQWAIFAGTTNWDAVGNGGATTPNAEITPDGNTSAVQSLTAGQLDDYALTVNAGISTFDTINVVAVGVYYEGVGASANAKFKLRLKNSSGGTADESAEIDPTSTGYVTNSKTAPRNFKHVRYFQQDGVTVWSQAALSTAQIGLNLSTGAASNRARVSTVWLSVDYTPELGAKNVSDIQNSAGQNLNQAGNRAGVI